MVSSCSTLNPLAYPVKCKLAKIPLVPLLNFNASFSGYVVELTVLPGPTNDKLVIDGLAIGVLAKPNS